MSQRINLKRYLKNFEVNENENTTYQNLLEKFCSENSALVENL